ncbi:6-bladed beta-propeller [Candidatus Fermentibacteria bacterium]|nr:6-bladed beta-propeller [Candidatus Fermentibacteria bacterium]
MEFKCPSCGGDLKVPDSEKTASCPYCGSLVLVPEGYAGMSRPSGGMTIGTAGTEPAVSRTKIAGCLVVMAALIMLVAGVAAVLFITAVRNDPGKLGVSGPGTDGSVLLRFGSPGTGTASFTDPRHVAVDGQGRIFVAEYGTGRIQVFDPEGSFLSQWFVTDAGGDVFISSIDAASDGRVFAVHGGRIGIFDGMTGDSLGELSGADGFEDVNVAGDGSIVATQWSAGDGIFRFSGSGEEELHVMNAVEDASGEPELSPVASTDGLGNIYILGVFNSAVFVFDRNGRFTDTFGSSGQGRGRFSAPSDIAVDSRGLVYVSDFSGIQVFDPYGGFLGTLDTGRSGYVFGMDFDPSGNLVVVTGDCEVLVIPPFEEQ